MSARHDLRHQYRQHRLERHESQHRHDRRPAWPDTVMAYAFLTALARWATAHHADPNARIMLPIGSVISRELIQVLRALNRAQQQTAVRRSRT